MFWTGSSLLTTVGGQTTAQVKKMCSEKQGRYHAWQLNLPKSAQL